MQHSEETAAAVAKAIEQVNEGWQRKFKAAVDDAALRKQLVEMVLKISPQPANHLVLLYDLQQFISRAFKDGEP